MWNKKNVAIADELTADDFILYSFGNVAKGRDAFKQSMGPFHTGFPDLRMTVEFTMAEGDKVAVRWRGTGTHNGHFRGIASTGKPVDIAGVAIYRVAGGKVVELWSQPDVLGILQQIGAIPSPGQAAR